jgi:hypothetical protein
MATLSEKRIFRTMSAPRWQRVSISSRDLAAVLEDVDYRPKPLGEARRRAKRSGRAPAAERAAATRRARSAKCPPFGGCGQARYVCSLAGQQFALLPRLERD